MKNTSEYYDVPDDLPCISIIIPYEEKISSKDDLDVIVNAKASEEIIKLMKNYPKNITTPIVTKLKRVIDHLEYKKSQKSIAIIVSPLIERVYYFDYTSQDSIIYKIAI